MTQTNSLFSFGIITDTHIRAPGGDLSTVFPVNTKANNRARHAVNLLGKEEHDFVIHLGDVVHPLPNMNSYFPAVQEAHKRTILFCDGIGLLESYEDVEEVKKNRER